VELIVDVTTLKFVDAGGGEGGVGDGFEDFLHWVKQISNANIHPAFGPRSIALFLSSLMVCVLFHMKEKGAKTITGSEIISAPLA
jgi:hypothetical protein